MHEIERDRGSIYSSLHSPLTSLLIQSSYAYFSCHFHITDILQVPHMCLQQAPSASSYEKVRQIPTLFVSRYWRSCMKKPFKFNNWITRGWLNNFRQSFYLYSQHLSTTNKMNRNEVLRDIINLIKRVIKNLDINLNTTIHIIIPMGSSFSSWNVICYYCST